MSWTGGKCRIYQHTVETILLYDKYWPSSGLYIQALGEGYLYSYTILDKHKRPPQLFFCRFVSVVPLIVRALD